jgi:hypothetical protein
MKRIFILDNTLTIVYFFIGSFIPSSLKVLHQNSSEYLEASLVKSLYADSTTFCTKVDKGILSGKDCCVGSIPSLKFFGGDSVVTSSPANANLSKNHPLVRTRFSHDSLLPASTPQ